MTFIATLLNRVTLYRLTLLVLVGLVVLATIFSVFDVLPYSPFNIAFSALYLVAVSYYLNKLCAWVVNTSPHSESAIITALILSLIVGPVSLEAGVIPLTGIALLAIASKYILAWKGRHVFNPAAIAVVLSAILFSEGASWWVGSAVLMPAVAFAGLLVAYKARRIVDALTFLGVYLCGLGVLSGITEPVALLEFVQNILLYSPALFFAFIMLPEPHTSPERSSFRFLYAAIVGVGVLVFQSFLDVTYTLELALVFGNVCAFLVSSRKRVWLRSVGRTEEAPSLVSFTFEPSRSLVFDPGQFIECTFPHQNPDSRGIRRYFTIASSPTEKNIILTAKIPETPSTFKAALMNIEKGDSVTATGPYGHFTLPSNKDTRCVFIAGGIGITPFRSMAKYMEDTEEKRDITLVYAATYPEEFLFSSLFDRVGITTIYTVTGKEGVPDTWDGERGPVDAALIQRYISELEKCVFYVSGPPALVRDVSNALRSLGVSKRAIRVDRFSGYDAL